MKTKLALIVALSCGLCASGSAFTLDFVGLVGTPLPPKLTINVPGYGTVDFEASIGSTLVVDNAFESGGFGGPSLTFAQDDTVKVTFNGVQPINVEFAFVGVSTGEAFDVQPDLFNTQAYVVILEGSGNGAGIQRVSWEQVPEPTSALLGTLGCALLLVRRRR